MNWIERLYEIKKNDHYSQNSEGIYLEYILHSLKIPIQNSIMFDIGGGDGFYLSNSRHLRHLGANVSILDWENGFNVRVDNCTDLPFKHPDIISIDIDGNDYWIIREQIPFYRPSIICAEFNPAYTDSRTIKYNPDHVWDGTDYYGFSFEAGKKLAATHGYKVIFQIANMNMIMVREDLIKVPIPEVTFKQNNFFKQSNRPEFDWVFV